MTGQVHEQTDWPVVDEAADVPVEPSIDAVYLAILVVKIKEVRVFFPNVSFRVRDELPDILADEGAQGDILQGPHAPAHVLCPVELQPCPEAVLHDAVPAASPAGTGVVALEDQGRLRHVELRQQPAVLGTDVQSGPSMAHHSR